MGSQLRVTAPHSSTGNLVRDSALGLVPETIDAMAALTAGVWKHAPLPPSILEILRLRNARTVNCVVCRSVRYDVARGDGLTEDKVSDIGDGYQASSLSRREKAAIAFADGYLRDPRDLTAESIAEIRSQYTPAEMAYMAAALLAFNAASRCAVGLAGMPEAMDVMEIPVSALG